MPEQVRYPLIVWHAMQVLREASAPLPGREVIDAVRPRLQPTAYETGSVKSGGVRWEVTLNFYSGHAATVGWMAKRGGWAITEAGLAALETRPSGRPNLMDTRVYERPDGLDRVWQYSIMPLLEDLFYGQHDLDARYGLASLRKAITAEPPLA